MQTEADRITHFAGGRDFDSVAIELDGQLLHSLVIVIGKDVAFGYCEPQSRILIQNSNDSTFFTIRAWLPNDTGWAWLAVVRYGCTKNGLSFQKDGGFRAPMMPTGEISQVKEKRNLLVMDSSYTQKDRTLIPEERIAEIDRLSGKLFIAALNGDVEAEKYFLRFREDFDIMYAGELSENYVTLEAILKLE